MDSAPDPRSWMANWSHQKKKEDILRVVDRSVTLRETREKPWRESFEKCRKSWNFRDFWWFFTNSGGGRSGCGLEIWTYILFGSISMSESQNFKNIGWSHGLQGRKSESTTRGPRGVCLVRAWIGPVDGRGGAKPKVRGKATEECFKICDILIIFGDFNSPRNHDEIDPKITMKSRIWTIEIDWKMCEVTEASR